jgi:hypothetical protein
MVSRCFNSSKSKYNSVAAQKIELSEGVMIYGKLGVHQWDSELNIASTTNAMLMRMAQNGAGLENFSMYDLQGRIVLDLDGEENFVEVSVLILAQICYNF